MINLIELVFIILQEDETITNDNLYIDHTARSENVDDNLVQVSNYKHQCQS